MKTTKLAESPNELQVAYGIRFKVFVDEQKVPPELELDEYDQTATHLLALEDGVPVGCGRLVYFEAAGDTYAQIGRVAVLKDKRGAGYGKLLCRELVNIARRRGFGKVVLYSQCSAEGFYHSLGFTPQGEVFEDAGIDHICMVKVF